MKRDEILDRVLALLAERLAQDGGSVSESSRLSESVLLDSFIVLEAVMALEEAFNISFDRGDLDYFDTPGNIADLVVRKLAAAGD